VTPAKTAAPADLLTQVADLLTQVAEERGTGALMVGGQPGGAVYLIEGRVIYAESPAAPGVGELLTSSGRLAGRTWQNALDLGTSTARVGKLLVEQGHLTQGELELCTLGAIYDAAYFALAPAAAAVSAPASAPGSAPGSALGSAPSSAPFEFLAGATHWLGAVVQIDPAAVAKEVNRRVGLLSEIFPDSRVDTAAVTPAPRPPRERVTLTAPQWELLINADGQRTPADLALLLGKAGYATIQELRRMAAMGLLELPDVRLDGPEFVRPPQARGTAVDATRPVVVNGAPVAGGRAVVPGAASAPPAAGTRPVVPGAASAPPAAGADPPVGSLNGGTVYRPPRLARRKPGAKLPKEMAGEAPPIHQGTDEVLLKRIRTALRALR
jgi:hypothetical protein